MRPSGELTATRDTETGSSAAVRTPAASQHRPNTGIRCHLILDPPSSIPVDRCDVPSALRAVPLDGSVGHRPPARACPGAKGMRTRQTSPRLLGLALQGQAFDGTTWPSRL